MNGKTKAYEIVGELLEKKRKSINFECETDGMGMRRRRRTSEKSGFLPFSFEDEEGEDQKYHPVFFFGSLFLPVCPFKAALQKKKRRYIINIIKALSVCLKKHHHYFHSCFFILCCWCFGVEKPLSLSTLKSCCCWWNKASKVSVFIYLSVFFLSLNRTGVHFIINSRERFCLFFTRASLFGSHTAFPLAHFSRNIEKFHRYYHRCIITVIIIIIFASRSI